MRKVYLAIALVIVALAAITTISCGAHKRYYYEVDRPGLHLRTNDHRNFEYGTVMPGSDYTPPWLARALEENPQAIVEVEGTRVRYNGSPGLRPKVLIGVCDNIVPRPIYIVIYVLGTNTVAYNRYVGASSYQEFSLEEGDYRIMAVFTDTNSDPTFKDIKVFKGKTPYTSTIARKQYEFGFSYVP